jgi:hypothetical protein
MVSMRCGGRIRTYDLQVMSLTSYRAALPRINAFIETDPREKVKPFIQDKNTDQDLL